MRGVVFLTLLYLLTISLPSLSRAHQEAPRQAQINAHNRTSTRQPNDLDYGDDEDVIDETRLEPEEQTMTTYEWASFFPIGPSPANASNVWNTSANANDKYVVVVKTNDKTLTMEMSEVADSDYDNVEVVVIRPNGTETFKVSDKIRYFKGVVRELNDSRAHGIFRTTGLFEGIIETDTETYFVESAIKFFGNGSIYSGSLDPTLAVIYRWQDLRQFPFETACNQKMLPCYYYQTMQHYRQLFPPEDILEARHGTDGKSTTRKRQTGKTCPMTIVADHRFFQNVGFGSVHKTLEAIVWHIEEVDHLYRQADWNNDKAPDRIGVSLDKVIIFTDAASPGNAFKDDTKDDEVFLKRFAGVNTTGSCVAAVFTFSDLGGTFGISYVGTVCASKYNWALINFRNVDGEIRQRAASVITIMHEVAHVFGANHDENETRCLPAGQNNGADNGGNYIMYPTSAFGLYDNNHRFSPCSVESIAKNFQDAKRTRCMIDRGPTTAPSRRRRATKRDVFR